MKNINIDDFKVFLNSVITQIQNFINGLIENDLKKAFLITNWLKYYFKYLKEESNFLNKKTYKKFKYGQVVRISFGYNLGHELGGIHYGVVISNNDSPYSSDLIVIPLSTKHKEIKNNNKDTRIDIGNELKVLVSQKMDLLAEKYFEDIKKLNLSNVSSNETKSLINLLNLYNELKNEFNNMSNGSIVLTSQIRFISKLRLMAPTTKNDYFDNIVLSKATMSKIMNKISSIIGYIDK